MLIKTIGIALTMGGGGLGIRRPPGRNLTLLASHAVPAAVASISLIGGKLSG